MNFSNSASIVEGNTLSSAVGHLLAGDLVAFPTETVYGLGADATSSNAVSRIFEVKGRPIDHPLIIHIASIEQMGEWARNIHKYAINLAETFWPGPMTLILNRSELARDFVTGGQETVGVRVPNHLVALALLEAFEKAGGKGIAAPSANRFGHVSPTSAEAVIEELGQYLSQDDLVLDGGASKVGVESTIIDCTGAAPSVLRPGAISVEMIEECTGLTAIQSESIIRVSGSLEKHYAPFAKILLCESATPGQGLIAHSGIKTPEGVIRLASPSNDEEFARMLYSALRDGDSRGLSEVVVMQPVGIGIAVAIRDRLSRAANGR